MQGSSLQIKIDPPSSSCNPHLQFQNDNWLRITLCLIVAFSTFISTATSESYRTADGQVAFISWFSAAIDDLSDELPTITASAERAAILYVQKDYAIRTTGDNGVWTEMIGRSGGIMEMNQPRKNPILLNFPTTEAELLSIDDSGLPDGASITFVPKWLVNRVTRLGHKLPKDIIVTHNLNQEGLFTHKDGGPLIYVDGIAAVAAAWSWTAEFVAACTRLGKMPTMYEGFAVPGGKDRAARLSKSNPKFHSESPIPVGGQKLGEAFLKALRLNFAKVSTMERENIQSLAKKTLSTLSSGRSSFIFPGSHVLIGGHLGGTADPEYFRRLNDGWFKIRSDIKLSRGDLVFCDAFDDTYTGPEYAEVSNRLHSIGTELAWSFAGYKTEAGHGPSAVGADEIFIDQHWDFGDAVVEVPGYDIKIIPTSGVLEEAVLRMVEAEIAKLSGGARGLEIESALDSIPSKITIPLESESSTLPIQIEYSPGLSADIYLPTKSSTKTNIRPAVILIHGGAWKSGSRALLTPHARWLASRGFVSINIDYRLIKDDGAVRVSDLVSDIGVAVEYIRKNANKWGINPAQIALLGESAGGHLAALNGLTAPINSRANAFILFNPILDTSSNEGWEMPESYSAKERLAISPIDRIFRGTPPMILFNGEADTTTPDSISKRFAKKMESEGNVLKLITVPNATHAFLLPDYGEPETINSVMEESINFLTNLGFNEVEDTETPKTKS